MSRYPGFPVRREIVAGFLILLWLLVPAGVTSATVPPGMQQERLLAGDLAISVSQASGGLHLDSLYDQASHRELLATNAFPLFEITLRREGTQEQAHLTAETGWERTSIQKSRGGLELRWEHPEVKYGPITVVATCITHARDSSFRWSLTVQNKESHWGVWRVAFPQLLLSCPGKEAVVLFPRGPGELQTNVWDRAFSYHGNYPGGWCSMQFAAAYAPEDQTGLYVGVHDPWGSVKDLQLDSSPASRSLRMRFDIPAANMGVAGNGYTLSGDAVWALLRGDWFDAAMIYRAWVSKEARWWPRLTRGERSDTPVWMRQLNAWAQTGGAPAECAPAVEKFQSFLNLPVGFHWYNWHQIPFDNDYPHYFPPKEGFARAVAELQRSNVFVMPYINGRLWDTHDRGAADFEFSNRARPAAAKLDNGEPYIETYGSKETNGEPVKLAVMCPTTQLWQQTIRETVLRLLKEQGTRAVYIDQIAAAPPALCMDKSHGHPLGGGHWWNEGYWSMLDAVRREMPRDCMLTTECNGEPFIRCFDGYLTWHWQYDGQVPVFPAIYGGAIQMFGRAYRGGATKDLALRMKAGQQFVFGEQLGWLDPNVAREPGNGDFFREVAQLRSRLAQYFHAGQMARPPKLLGTIPKVKADWQWSGEWWVTTDAVLTGAWEIPREKRLVFLFANVGDEPVTAKFHVEPAVYGLPKGRVKIQTLDTLRPWSSPQPAQLPFEPELRLAPRHAEALEIDW